jgi:hypothetical protein
MSLEHHFLAQGTRGSLIYQARDISQDNFILRLVFWQCPDRIELSSYQEEIKKIFCTGCKACDNLIQ